MIERTLVYEKKKKKTLKYSRKKKYNIILIYTFNSSSYIFENPFLLYAILQFETLILKACRKSLSTVYSEIQPLKPLTHEFCPENCQFFLLIFVLPQR